jgi:hypothetical protein
MDSRIFNLSAGWVEWLASRPGRLSQRPSKEEKVSCLFRELNPGSSIAEPSNWTDSWTWHYLRKLSEDFIYRICPDIGRIFHSCLRVQRENLEFRKCVRQWSFSESDTKLKVIRETAVFRRAKVLLRRWLMVYRRFGTACRSHLQELNSPKTNYELASRNVPPRPYSNACNWPDAPYVLFSRTWRMT